MSENRASTYGAILSKMIQCETISSRFDSDVSKFYKFHAILEENFPRIHSVCEKHDFNGSLLFRWKGKQSERPIMLMSHHDVVEATGEWKYPPFSGEITGDIIWGRGTVDTKASLFCILQSVEELIKDGFVPEQDVYIASSCTEEISTEGAPLTAKYLKEQGVKLRLLLDEGGMIIEEPMKGVKGKYAMVGCLEKGYGDLRFVAKSNGGHASAPGKNTPWARLAAMIHELETKSPFYAKVNPTVAEMFDRMGPNAEGSLGFVFRHYRLFKKILEKKIRDVNPLAAAMMQTTLAFTMGKGADGLNVLPQEAYVTGNIRFIPHQAVEESLAALRKVASKYDVEVEVITAENPAPVVDHNGEVFKFVEETILEQFSDLTVCPYPMTGGTDCRHYTEVCDNCIRFAPLLITNEQRESIHGLNENINLSSLPGGVDFYKEIIRKNK